MVHDRAEVLHLAVDADGECRLGETGADRRRDLGAAHRLVELADGTVRKGNIDHRNHLERSNANTTYRPAERASGQRPGSGTSARARPYQVRKVVSVVGAGKNNRSMRPGDRSHEPWSQVSGRNQLKKLKQLQICLSQAVPASDMVPGGDGKLAAALRRQGQGRVERARQGSRIARRRLPTRDARQEG